MAAKEGSQFPFLAQLTSRSFFPLQFPSRSGHGIPSQLSPKLASRLRSDFDHLAIRVPQQLINYRMPRPAASNLGD
jgi:hypothetical protein